MPRRRPGSLGLASSGLAPSGLAPPGLAPSALVPSALVPSALALVLPLLAACAGADATDLAVQRLEAELARARAEGTALAVRLSALEERGLAGGAEATARPRIASPREGDRPTLEVVHLVPSGPDEPPLLDDSRARRVTEAERAELARSELARGEALFTAKKYEAALGAFAGFLVRFPEHPSAPHATRRRGECYFHKGEHARAAEQLEAALVQAPKADGAPEALSLLATAYDRAGDAEGARRARERLARDFPDHAAQKLEPREGSR